MLYVLHVPRWRRARDTIKGKWQGQMEQEETAVAGIWGGGRQHRKVETVTLMLNPSVSPDRGQNCMSHLSPYLVLKFKARGFPPPPC